MVSVNLDITFLIQIVNFLVAIFVLNLVLIRPVRKILAERRERLHGFIAEAEKFNGASDMRLKNYAAELAAARNKAGEQKELIRLQGLDAEQSILGSAQNEAQGIAQKSRRDVERELAEARLILRGRIESMSARVVARLLG
ncbi:MAG: ATP synthase F0 subunit B [Deltaproteobacteria bacterium]|jgi:F-type H+-transporting ATPase subunit b|nr:ATP synthase F0 subunit B [Deltaproteobacteria bacterium]